MSKIPKVIHYCWFGGNPLPPLAQKCIASWKKYCPDYTIIEWNEKNFDFKCNQYVYEAYHAKKWAFVSDYTRLYVLNEYGGVYMDTDVELLKNIDPFLKHIAFSGFESSNCIAAGIIGSVKDNSWLKMLLSYYNDRHFIMEDSSYDLTTIVITISQLTKAAYNIDFNNSLQVTSDGLALYPKDYFYPKEFETGKTMITQNTYAIHYYDASWVSKKRKIRHFFSSKLKKLIGKELIYKLTEYLNRKSTK